MRQELLGLEGVISAEVSYDEKLATVRYVSEQVTPRRMIEAIDSTGFSASLIDEPTRQQPPGGPGGLPR